MKIAMRRSQNSINYVHISARRMHLLALNHTYVIMTVVQNLSLLINTYALTKRRMTVWSYLVNAS